ncbi:hypothetical protein BGW38_003947 [Lunasporangiospora selenospora]|uniref:EF-hand domain-containing protein n=1 Tax=Lunasporangiospora selenospora TaxID=979761 RepID=A0A9P6FR59_9FUNG|nr:hypothetical protein BGW38_003947 [Lunasporangiospora selenospora]
MSSRPPLVQSTPQFVYSHSPHPHSNQFSFPPSLSTTPPLDRTGAATNIDMERIMKQDEAAMNDFVPPRQAMNSDESDFDWDEDVNIDANGQVLPVSAAANKKDKKSNSKWRKLSPFLRTVIQILTVGPIIALPAVLVTIFMEDDQPVPEDPNLAHPGVPKTIIVLIFAWIAFMWCIICVTNWGVDIIPVMVVRLSSMMAGTRLEKVRSRLLIFVATKKYLKFLLAACWAIGSFGFLSKVPYRRADEKLNPVFIEVLATIVAGCGLVLIEKILLHMISTNFHQIAYADRIKENKFALTVLDRLSTSKNKIKKIFHPLARPTHSRNNSDYIGSVFSGGYKSAQPSRSNSLEMGGVGSNGVKTTGTASNGTHNMNNVIQVVSDTEATHDQGTFSGGEGTPTTKANEFMILGGTPMTTPTDQNNSRHSTLLSQAARQARRDGKTKSGDGNIFRGINRRLQGIAYANKHSPAKDIGSTANAKRLAKTLFYNLKQQHGRTAEELLVEDFYRYFDTEEEAKEAFLIFDKDCNGDISKREMKEKIFYIYKERKDLHTSLRDLSQAVGKLDIIFLTVVAVVWLLIVLSIFGKNVVQNMLSIGSFLLALSFVFGNSLKILFENIVFLFITHPYDSGDLVVIDGAEMFVREVGLNSTTFVTWDGKRMYYPNNFVSTRPIHNVRRSPNMSEKIVLNVDCYTPQAKILELRARMRDYLINQSKDFLPDMEIQIQEMDAKLKISMVIEHRGNWQDAGRRWARRTAFNYALKEAVEDIGIQYYALPQRLEVYKRDVQDLDLSMSRGQGDDQDTLGNNSPLRQYSPEHLARLYRRPTFNRPHEGGGE